jgi:ribosomal protein S18 acetylase RimI-like enzyme
MSDSRIETLTEAFYHDPLAEFFWPDGKSRTRGLSAGAKFLLDLSSKTWSSETTEGKCAAVIGAAEPGGYPPPFFRSIFALCKLTLRLPSLGPLGAMGKWSSISRQLGEIHPRRPHWYIWVLGAHPNHQGKGLGGKLLRPILQNADENSVVVYLECSNPKSLDFYKKYRFQVTKQIVPVSGGPPIWGLERKPTPHS